MKNKKLPPIHPGEILIEEFLKPMGISQYRLAKEVHLHGSNAASIIDEAITDQSPREWRKKNKK